MRDADARSKIPQRQPLKSAFIQNAMARFNEGVAQITMMKLASLEHSGHLTPTTGEVNVIAEHIAG